MRLLAVIMVCGGLAFGACSSEDPGTVADAGDTTSSILDVSFADGGFDTAVTDTAVATDTGGTAPEDTAIAADAGDTTVVADTSPPADTAQTFAGTLAADPASFTFSYISPLTATMTKQVTLYNTGNGTLDITKIAWASGSSRDFDIVLIPPLPKSIAPGHETLLTVRFREIEGGQGTLQITSTDAANPVTTLIFKSFLKSTSASPEPCVALTPARLDFGTVQRGSTKTLPATLSNCGTTSPLVLSSVTRSQIFFFPLSQAFQITNLPGLPTSIPPGGSVPIQVAYTPTLAGLDAGYFAFHTDDPNQPQAQLDVSGVALQPPVEELGLHIKVAWNTDDTDIDSHLLMPGGTFFDCFSDCYFGNRAPDWGVTGAIVDDPFLDVDDVDGYGPENINISEPIAGTYTFIIHYYADSHSSFAKASDTTVEVYSFGVLLRTFGPTRTAATNDTWDVFTIDWPSKAITPLGRVWTVPGGVVSSCGFNFP